MKTLYFHIGSPKTGTTAIQLFGHKNQEALEQRGYVLPRFPFKYHGYRQDRNGSFLTAPILDEDGKKDPKAKAERIQEGLELVLQQFETHEAVILSEETYWKVLGEGRMGQLENLKKFCDEHEIVLKIIVYLRRQDLFLESWWRQRVKMGAETWGMSWEELVEDGSKFPGHLDYYDRLKRIENIIGKEDLIVRRYERSAFRNGDITADFLETIGITDTTGFIWPANDANTSLDCDYTEIKRVLNKLDSSATAYSKENNFFMNAVLECSTEFGGKSKERLMSEEETREFLERYKEENEKIAREYLGSEDGVLFYEDMGAVPKWEFDEKKMYDAAVLTFGNITFALKEEADKRHGDLNGKQRDMDKRLRECQRQLKKMEDTYGKQLKEMKDTYGKQLKEQGERLAKQEKKLESQTKRIDRLRKQMDILLLPALPVRKLVNIVRTRGKK